jgi:hypothetical protein
MKKQKKTALIAVLMIFGAAALAFTQTTGLGDLQNSVKNFSEKLAGSLPFSSALGLNWADAYIGQLIGVPPHFGVGVSSGITTLDFESIDTLTGYFDTDLPLNWGKLPVPGYTVEARVGGFILPFDAGLKFGIIPKADFGEMDLNYTLIGGDIRYAILKDNVVLPTISLGVGVNYLAGGLSVKTSGGQSFTFDGPAVDPGPHTLALSDPEVGFTWEATTIDFKAQISKSFLIITPYFGIGASHSWSKAGYSVESRLTYDGNTMDDTAEGYIRDFLANQGAEGIDFDGDEGFSSFIETTGWSLRAFGGISFNLAVFRIDLTGLFNFFDANYGASLGLRFQL